MMQAALATLVSIPAAGIAPRGEARGKTAPVARLTDPLELAFRARSERQEVSRALARAGAD